MGARPSRCAGKHEHNRALNAVGLVTVVDVLGLDLKMNRCCSLAIKSQHTGTRVPDLVAKSVNIIMRGPKAVVAPADVLGKVGQPYVEFQEPFVLVRSQTTGRQPSGGQNRPKLVPGILVVRSLSG